MKAVLRVAVAVSIIIGVGLVLVLFRLAPARSVASGKVDYSKPGYFAYQYMGEDQFYMFFLPIDGNGKPVSLVFADSAQHAIKNAYVILRSVSSKGLTPVHVALLREGFQSIGPKDDPPFTLEFKRLVLDKEGIFFESEVVQREGYVFRFSFKGKREGRKIIGQLEPYFKYPGYTEPLIENDYLEFLLS